MRGSRPLTAWIALAQRASFGIDLSETGTARLVGRDRELELLAGSLSRARETRDPQLVTLVGVPGIGKSRLVRELFRIVEEEEELIYWRQGRSLPYGEGVAFWALGEMVKAQAGILESDDAEAAAAKLDRAIQDLGLDDDQVAWLRRHLRPLVGLVSGDDATPERGEVFAAWRRLVEALAEKGPAVFVFEDLQWADDGMLDFVDELVDWVTGVPLLVVASARPELLERRPGWGGGKRNALTISLSPLSDDDTAQLLADLLDRALLPAETQRALLAHAAGNPLFAEEYARMLSAGDGTTTGVPESLQALVAARIDGLPVGEKTLLQAGSVLGKVFWTDAAMFLAQGDHGGAAEAEAELAQYHWRRGAGDNVTEHLARALDFVSDVPPSRARAAVLSVGGRLFTLSGRGEEGLVLAEEASRIAADLSLDDLRAAALNSLASAKVSLGRPDGLAATEEGLTFALEVSPSEAARGYINLASTTIASRADVRRGREVHGQGLPYVERFGLTWHARWLRGELALDAYRLGEWTEAMQLAEDGIAAAERAPHYMEGAARNVRGLILAARGRAEAAVADMDRSLELAREIKDPQALEPTLAGAAYVSAKVGRTPEARALLAELGALLAQGVGPIFEPWYLAEYAVALRACDGDRGGLEIARRRSGGSAWLRASAAYHEQFEEAAELMREIGVLPYEAAARVAAAEAHLAAGRRAQATEQLEQALAFYRRVDATAFLAEAERLLPAAS